jgi:hypothetical protein
MTLLAQSHGPVSSRLVYWRARTNCGCHVRSRDFLGYNRQERRGRPRCLTKSMTWARHHIHSKRDKTRNAAPRPNDLVVTPTSRPWLLAHSEGKPLVRGVPCAGLGWTATADAIHTLSKPRRLVDMCVYPMPNALFLRAPWDQVNGFLFPLL